MSFGYGNSNKPRSNGGKHYDAASIVRAWVRQETQYGWTRSAHVSFRGDAFYSYGTVIARRIRGRKACGFVVDQARFSATTGGHQGMLRGALNNVFYVNIGGYNQGLEFTPVRLRDYYIAQFNDRKASTARINAIREREFLQGINYLQQAVQVCRHFGLSERRPLFMIESFSSRIEEARKIVELYERNVKDGVKKRADAKQARIDEAHRVAVNAAVKQATAWSNKYNQWRTPEEMLSFEQFFGFDFRLLNSVPALKASMLALKLRCVEKEHAKSFIELSRENWALEAKVDKAEERAIELEKFQPKPRTRIILPEGRMINLED